MTRIRHRRLPPIPPAVKSVKVPVVVATKVVLVRVQGRHIVVTTVTTTTTTVAVAVAVIVAVAAEIPAVEIRIEVEAKVEAEVVIAVIAVVLVVVVIVAVHQSMTTFLLLRDISVTWVSRRRTQLICHIRSLLQMAVLFSVLQVVVVVVVLLLLHKWCTSLILRSNRPMVEVSINHRPTLMCILHSHRCRSNTLNSFPLSHHHPPQGGTNRITEDKIMTAIKEISLINC